jgi:hypothetical protein
MCKCINCNKEKETEKIRLHEDDGFMSSSRTEEICSDCFKENIIATEKGYFLKINGKMYHETLFGGWEMIRSKNEIDYIFNKGYYDVLKMFSE